MLILLTAVLAAAPPKVHPPTPEQSAAIQARLTRLRGTLAQLERLKVPALWRQDIAVHVKAAEWVVAHNEFLQKRTAAQTVAVLDRGLLRASQAGRGDAPWLNAVGRPVARGYVSSIDGSVQPYAVTLPKKYSRPAGDKRWRLDVVLHGRSKTLTEVKFLAEHDGSKPAPDGQDFITLEVYGRGNNAYRWAGETDVYGAVEDFLRREAALGRGDWIDTKNIVLRGFSMGGAGAWHIGLHRPGRWAVVGPGAGFVTTRGYVRNLPETLPDYQERCLHIYDAVDYAANARHVPVVAYAGSEDKQLAAARRIQAALKPLGVPMKLLVAPGLGHKFPREWQAKADAEYRKHVLRGRPQDPDRVRFTTFTLKYNACEWIELLGLGGHYRKATVDAARVDNTIRVQTENVTALRLRPPGGEPLPEEIVIDGQGVDTTLFAASFARQLVAVKRHGRWRAVLPQLWRADRLRRPRKSPGLQGPIDDAFMGPFVCVTGSGDPWHRGPADLAGRTLGQFRELWGEHLRGALPVKRADQVTAADIAGRHLVLFGDPGSNPLIAQIADRLPIRWTEKSITAGDQQFDAGGHLPCLICPNPLNPSRYVVINSGHTFGDAAFRGTNALLYPRLGDYAVLRSADGGVAAAGLFDESWQIPTPEKPQ